MKNQLLYSMAFYVFYMWILALYMFRSRVRAITSGEVPPKYFKTYTGQTPAEKTLVIGRHYDNQFQVPLLFFAGGTLHIVLNTTNTTTVIIAWLFALSRLLHSFVHLGSNMLQKRVAAFAIGWLMIVLLWGQLIYLA